MFAGKLCTYAELRLKVKDLRVLVGIKEEDPVVIGKLWPNSKVDVSVLGWRL